MCYNRSISGRGGSISDMQHKYTFLFLSEKGFLTVLFGTLFLLGSHFLDYYPWIFFTVVLFLIDWKQVTAYESVLAATLFISMYVIWYMLDPTIAHRAGLFVGQGALAVLMFLLGRSLVSRYQSTALPVKPFFYSLFLFFIAYMLTLVYSYLFVEQNRVLSSWGMHVCFPNEYARININGGNLISTILAYYLAPMAILTPFILFYWGKLQKEKFHTIELIALLALSLFALFLAAEMGRRTVMLLFAFSFVYLSVFRLKSYMTIMDRKRLWGIALLLVALTGIGVYLLLDTPAMQRLLLKGFDDVRFGWWSQGLQAMIDYPWGGGYDVIVGNRTKLAHNVWIDMGKDYGIIPFIILILFSASLAYRFFSFLFFSKADIVLKHLVFLMGVVIFSIFMIEPVFNSDKTFFIYAMYFFGIITILGNKKYG